MFEVFRTVTYVRPFKIFSHTLGTLELWTLMELSPLLPMKKITNNFKSDPSLLWCKQPEVKNSNFLEIMGCQEIEMQERWFEILTSERSYFKTLGVIKEIAIDCQPILNTLDLNFLFTSHLDNMIASPQKYFKNWTFLNHGTLFLYFPFFKYVFIKVLFSKWNQGRVQNS